LNKIPGLAGQSMVIRDNHSIKHIYDAHQEEEAVFTCLRMSTFYLALTDAIHSFACISDILFSC
ncbi:hypothetical protein, partial [Paenibacillus larvae]|uniref:hypothetical protein n=1 Tax=Paenibacillus larvae TaxID=1464 RepID=UPI0022830D46